MHTSIVMMNIASCALLMKASGNRINMEKIQLGVKGPVLFGLVLLFEVAYDLPKQAEAFAVFCEIENVRSNSRVAV